MKYLRPFDPDALRVGEVGPWLLGPDEGAGCAIRLRRGGGAVQPTALPSTERIALVLRGTAQVNAAQEVPVGGVLFLPQGSTAAFSGSADSVWIEIEAEVPAHTGGDVAPSPISFVLDETKFQGDQFAHQSLLDRTKRVRAMKMNALRVVPGGGSPDYHIHAFAQMYVIQEGEMTLDIGRKRFKAPMNTLVYLPPGVVHRNFNATRAVERHVSLLIPEIQPHEIFDYAVTIHEREAELLAAPPT